MTLVITTKVHYYSLDETFAFELDFTISGITVNTVISEPYCVRISEFRRLIYSLISSTPYYIHIGFYRGSNGEGSIYVDDKDFVIITDLSGSGGDVGTNVRLQ